MTATDRILSERPSAALPIRSGVVWLGIALLAIVAFFWPGLVSLPTAWARPEYSHGYLIPPIAAYLFLSQLARDDRWAAGGDTGRSWGTALLLLGFAVGWLGNASHIPDITTYGFIVALGGLVLIVMGTGRGLRQWPAIVYLAFMLPLPNFIYWPLSIRLQLLSSEIGVDLISMMGIPVLLEGNVIDLGIYKLQVAEACSGLRYLFPLMSFGFLFAALYRGPAWHKALLFLSGAPITILMNCVRIAVVGFLVAHFGIDQAEGFLHFFEGWIIFVACVLILYLLAFILQRLTRNPMPVHRMMQVDFAMLGAQFGRARAIPSSRALVVAATVAGLAAIAWYAVPARAAVEPERDPLVLFPLEVGDWRGNRTLISTDVEQVLAADDYLVVNYLNPTSATGVNLFIAYYRSQTNGSGIHSPEVCLPTGGWEVSRWTSADTGIAVGNGETLTVNRAIIQKGLSQQLVYYWFQQRGRSVTGDYAAKFYTVLDSLTRGRTDGALVRVVTPIVPGEAAGAADARLREILGLAVPLLPDYVPD